MNTGILKPFWNMLSNRHIEKSMDKLQIVKIQLMNQYVFLIALIFIVDAIRNLYLAQATKFVILSGIGCVLFSLSWYTKIYFDIKIAVCVFICLTPPVLFMCSVTGFYNGILPYYFAILFAALFIFNDKYRLYNTFVFVWVFILFYIVPLLDLQLFDSVWENQISFPRSQQATVIQSLLLLVTNGYFIMLKNSELQELYRQATEKETIGATQHIRISRNTTTSIEDVVKLARSDDAAFIVAFNQIFPDFYRNLLQLNSDMTQEEFKFCALLKLGFTTKDVSNCNHLAVRSVQTKKNRLRKSFRVPPQKDLYTWVAQF